MRYIKTIVFMHVMVFVFGVFCLCPRAANSQNLTINNQCGFRKDMVSFKVSIKMALNAVQSFGFDLHFDPEILEYSDYNRGKMMEEYDFMDCTQLKPGILRCGGFDKGEHCILAGQAGVMVVLYFHKINCKNTILSLKQLTDDLEFWCPGVGRFFCLGN